MACEAVAAEEVLLLDYPIFSPSPEIFQPLFGLVGALQGSYGVDRGLHGCEALLRMIWLPYSEETSRQLISQEEVWEKETIVARSKYSPRGIRL